LFWFLKGDAALPAAEASPRYAALATNAALALLFAIPHSVLLVPTVRRRLSKWIAAPFYGLFYTTVTCASLLVVFSGWRTVGPVVWSAAGGPRLALEGMFYASWGALFYSLHLTGLGFQTGLTPWLAWARGEPAPRREFAPRGAYRRLRHPVYLSFLGLVWFTPQMTLDHAVLTAVWTGYLFVGSWLKDRRLEYYIGEPYREYQTQVAGYPLVPFGPLGRRGPSRDNDALDTKSATRVA
jgi:protein-S-isoprenylcysteine O-methyltransferase Ste14